MDRSLKILEHIIPLIIFYPRWAQILFVSTFGLLLLSIFILIVFYPSASSKQKQISKTVALQKPTFSEKVDTVNFSLGERGITVGYKVSVLEKESKEPFDFSGYKPIRLYITEGSSYADVHIYGGSGLPPIELTRNQLVNKPPNWDFNSNKQALEIVNENQLPIYQFYYKTASHIVINGIFPFPGGLILANESGAIVNPTLPATFSLRRIFKYPSWKYPGQYEEGNAR